MASLRVQVQHRAVSLVRLLGVHPAIMHQHAELIRKADAGMLRAEQEVFFPATPVYMLPEIGRAHV
jgi:hypothetical protein